MNGPSSRFALLLALVFLLGCSPPETVEVSGTVTWNGEPLPHGDIMLVPDDPHIATAAGKISDGAFYFRSKPGKKRVEILSYRLSSEKTPQGRPIGEMYLPNRYNSNSELTVDISFDADNEFDFALRP